MQIFQVKAPVSISFQIYCTDVFGPDFQSQSIGVTVLLTGALRWSYNTLLQVKVPHLKTCSIYQLFQEFLRAFWSFSWGSKGLWDLKRLIFLRNLRVWKDFWVSWVKGPFGEISWVTDSNIWVFGVSTKSLRCFLEGLKGSLMGRRSLCLSFQMFYWLSSNKI